MARSDLRALVGVAALAGLGIGVFTLGGHGSDVSASPVPTAAPTSVAPTVGATVAPDATGATIASAPTSSTTPGTDPATAGGQEDNCVITERSIHLGNSGPSVTCLQAALAAKGLYTGAISGEFDAATDSAVRTLQEQQNLYVDGVAGRETGIFLGIWPDEMSLVVHTPKPAPGAVDLMGYRLSSVASAGSDAPPLPPDSGSGRRLVYSRAGQRIWAVDENGRIIRSWLVSGSKYNNEQPGTHEVYSRSEVSTAWNGKAYLPLMVRWLDTERGAIGFHGIPIHVADGTPYQTDAELGQRLSGGCQRQDNLDAKFVWDFAQIGTKVVVV